MFSKRTRHGDLPQPALDARSGIEPSGLATTVSALVVCWWELIEIALDFTSTDDAALATTIGTRLIVVVCGLAVVLNSRIARSVFCFLCAMSALAIAPALAAVHLTGPLLQPAVAFIDCVTKILFLASSLLSSIGGRRPDKRNISPAFAPAVVSPRVPDADSTTHQPSIRAN
ncbi:hypothetical protein AB4Y40_23660 [Paraburkholderia sp. EG287B]|uniref:hypothetical protein n=1 Tax=Paraburkholderia sp. EG287B TaxID=3237010 RepID=UPI0034D23BD1